jgi:hypothetical protein
VTPELAANLYPRQAGQHPIQQYQVGWVLARGMQAVLSIHRNGNFKTLPGQIVPQQLNLRRFIFDHKDFGVCQAQVFTSCGQ